VSVYSQGCVLTLGCPREADVRMLQTSISIENAYVFIQQNKFIAAVCHMSNVKKL